MKSVAVVQALGCGLSLLVAVEVASFAKAFVVPNAAVRTSRAMDHHRLMMTTTDRSGNDAEGDLSAPRMPATTTFWGASAAAIAGWALASQIAGASMAPAQDFPNQGTGRVSTTICIACVATG